MNFSEKVYKLTKKIPEGKVSTYKIIAERLGTKAYRVVGNALRKNPCKEVPCHRVINSNGKIGSYKGIKNNKGKIRLLRKEGIKTKKDGVVDFGLYLYRF